ncbi:MAG TPA: hypothetical protein PLA69_07465 [Flavobacterium sp.]|nr:hypothetical protein [Flavobacterium sp.]
MELTKTKIGVYLDYSIAFLLEQKDDENLITIIRASDMETAEAQVKPLTRHRRNREFIRKIFDLVKSYDRISIFGKQSAQSALIRQLEAIKDSEIEIVSLPPAKGKADQQRIDFINNYFKD